jgi:SpoVK/Ycf46/Vps4 family AAA+-type ATPase
LNELDGLREKADIFSLLTTNRPETLEDALNTRLLGGEQADA